MRSRPRHQEAAYGMPRLAGLQRQFHRLVTRPLGPGLRNCRRWPDGTPVHHAADAITLPGPDLAAIERVDIYNRQYWYRLLDSLAEDFPVLEAVLGRRRFLRLCIEYLCAHPSRSHTLRDLGQDLCTFLGANPELTSPRESLALDVARFEWAKIEALDAAERQPLRAADLLAGDIARARLALQPHVRLLRLDHPVDQFALRLRSGAVEEGRATSEAPAAFAAPRRARRVALPRPETVWLAVHRHAGVLYYKRLDPRAMRILSRLERGATIAAIFQPTAWLSDGADALSATRIQQWFAEWAQLGWLCRHRDKSRNTKTNNMEHNEQ